MKTTPIIEMTIASCFDKNIITFVLTRLHNAGCILYHLSDKEKNAKSRIEITIDEAAEYLSDPLNKDPHIRSILVAIQQHYFEFFLYHNGSLAGLLSLRLSPLKSTKDISPWVLSLLNIAHGAPIISLNTILDEC